jgi:hypothetical protein
MHVHFTSALQNEMRGGATCEMSISNAYRLLLLSRQAYAVSSLNIFWFKKEKKNDIIFYLIFSHVLWLISDFADGESSMK